MHPNQRSVDGFATRPTLTQPVIPRPITPRAYARPKAPVPRKGGVPQQLQMPLIIIGALLGGVFVQSAMFGTIAVVAYGIAAVVWRVASRTTFLMALLAMVATTLLLVIRGNVAMAQNFATYTFLLLVVGVITLTVELKKEGGRIYSSRR